MNEQIPVIVAFLAGIFSFVSPCILPLIPAYISFITGLSINDLNDSSDKKVHTGDILLDTLLFVAGFSVVFILLGATATWMGGFISKHQAILRTAGGLLVILFGLHISGIIRIKQLEYEKKIHLMNKPANIMGSFVIGIVFAFGWTPCIGPILAGILTYASTRKTVSEGIILLAAYSAGLAVPFILTSIAVSSFLRLFRKVNRYSAAISLVSGILLIIVGVLIMTDNFRI